MENQPFILIAIDGTWSDKLSKDYSKWGIVSHVKKFHDEFDGAKEYFDGPTGIGLMKGPAGLFGIDGFNRESKGREYIDFINYSHNKVHKICLVGWSRGAHIAIELAKRLPEVHFLGLFDAVDRTPFADSYVIPGNVKHTYHATRDRFLDSGASRSMGNTGLSSEGGMWERNFTTTHGGLGGFPAANYGPGHMELDDLKGVLSTALLMKTMQFDIYGRPILDAQYKKMMQENTALIDHKSAQIKPASDEAYNWMKNCAKSCGLPFSS